MRDLRFQLVGVELGEHLRPRDPVSGQHHRREVGQVRRLPHDLVTGRRLGELGRLFLWTSVALFVGANLLQSAFTRWCPAMTFFRKLGLKEG